MSPLPSPLSLSLPYRFLVRHSLLSNRVHRPWLLLLLVIPGDVRLRSNEVVTTCCSDALTRTAMSGELRLQYLQNLTDLLSRTFKAQFVFPALGHEDIGVSFEQLSLLWQQWLPQEAMDTYLRGWYWSKRSTLLLRSKKKKRKKKEKQRKKKKGTNETSNDNTYIISYQLQLGITRSNRAQRNI